MEWISFSLEIVLQCIIIILFSFQLFAVYQRCFKFCASTKTWSNIDAIFNIITETLLFDLKVYAGHVIVVMAILGILCILCKYYGLLRMERHVLNLI
jgi:hypothetical protein